MMMNRYLTITEMPGDYVSQEQLDMICFRYYTASNFTHGKDVLEVGCGPGIGLGYLSKTAKKVIGGDYCERILWVAKDYYGNRVKLLLLDAHTLPFKDDTFDVVLLFEAIFYLHEPESFLEESRRILRKGGVLILCLPNKEIPGFKPSPLSTHYFNAMELFPLLTKYGFKVAVYGAFSIERPLIIQKIISVIRLSVVKVMSLTSQGRQVKESLKKRILKKKIILGNEIDENASKDYFQLIPILPGSSDVKHRFLYVIAQYLN